MFLHRQFPTRKKISRRCAREGTGDELKGMAMVVFSLDCEPPDLLVLKTVPQIVGRVGMGSVSIEYTANIAAEPF